MNKDMIKILDDMRQCYSLLFIALNKIQAEADSRLKDLTSRQLMVIIAIAHLKQNEATIINIADILGTSKQNITRLVSLLQKNGYLIRRQNSEDRRSINISLTDKGINALNNNIDLSTQFFLDIFKNFNKDEIIDFKKSLMKLSDYDNSHKKYLQPKISVHNKN